VENQRTILIEATDVERASFYRKTYLHVALAILAFVGVETILMNVVPVEAILWMLSGKFIWLFLIGLFWLGSILSDRLAFHPSREQQYLGLGLYVLLEALIFLPLLYIAMYYAGGGEVILQAAGITLFMFAGLTAVVFITKADFSFLRTILVVGGFVALGVIVMGAIFGWNLGLWFSTAMVILAVTSIMYQTHQLRNQYATDQYVGAALKLFASIMLLFWYILRILMSRRS
jgi:FtsH-binding integral membrane protein